MRPSERPQQTGFTLIEVMVALVIVSIGLAAVGASVSQMVDAATTIQQRTYASWIAQNRIAEMRLENIIPEVDTSSGEVRYANTDWTWRADVSETGVENLFRVDVEVSLAGSDDTIRTVTGFIGEPVIPGNGNLIWSQGGPGLSDPGDEDDS
ncbi:MAG: type II secretion system minor pseudopilin GspI [Gammaproteobacteria bacterium]|nr:type II secretion system minor pseudopilin GspI [Gammaproteobacteria bacterium]